MIAHAGQIINRFLDFFVFHLKRRSGTCIAALFVIVYIGINLLMISDCPMFWV